MSSRLRVLSLLTSALLGCATVPEPKFEKHTFPKNAYVGDVQRPYTVLGPVRSKVDYVSLDPNHEEGRLCRNYYNKSVRELTKYAKRQGADAVVDVQSVVFLEDGRRETYKTPECSDDGGEGQVLTQGVAVKWKQSGAETGEWVSAAERPAGSGVAEGGSPSSQASPPSQASSSSPATWSASSATAAGASTSAAVKVPAPTSVPVASAPVMPVPTTLPAPGTHLPLAGEGVELARPRRSKPLTLDEEDHAPDEVEQDEALAAEPEQKFVPRPQGPVTTARRPLPPKRRVAAAQSEEAEATPPSSQAKREPAASERPNLGDPRRTLRFLP